MNTARLSATTSRLLAIALCAASASGSVSLCYAVPSAQRGSQAAGSSPATRRIGAIKTINGTQITLTPDSGPDVNVTLQDSTRIVRIAPGEKDLKNAASIQLQDLQVGDRVLVAGKASDDNQSLVASSVVVMKRSDLEARNEQNLQDWQKRGVDGIAKAVDAAAGTVTISLRNKDVVIHVSKSTVVRRYAPDSVKFDEAKPSTLLEIHPGDQVRARGDRSSDGSELTAEEIVSGSFRNIAGTINSADASSSTLSVHDLVSKKTLLIRITPDSQLHQLSPEMAQGLALRLKRAALGGVPGSGPGSDSSANGLGQHAAVTPGATTSGGSGMGHRPGGAPDLQQMLNRIPTVSLADLHKGEAVIILSTEGTAGVGTAVTLLTGVEPILQAAPGASGASILTPWSLSAPSGDAGGP